MFWVLHAVDERVQKCLFWHVQNSIKIEISVKKKKKTQNSANTWMIMNEKASEIWRMLHFHGEL